MFFYEFSGSDIQCRRVRFPAGLRIFLFTASRPASGSTQPPIQWVPGALSLSVRLPGCEADYSPASNAKVKNTCSYTSTPQYVFMVWCSVKHRNHFTLRLTLCHRSPTISNGCNFAIEVYGL